MKMNDINRKRQMLFQHFENCIKKEFSFLNNWSYSLDKSNLGWRVNYSSDKVTVGILYATNCEIDLVISLEGNPKCSVDIDEIVILVGRRSGNKKPNRIRQYVFALDNLQIEETIKELKELLLQYGSSFLEGEKDSFNIIAAMREENRKKYEREQTLKNCEERASKAWANNDYNQVVRLYEDMFEDLTEIQIKKLQIARKKIKM